MELRQLRYFVIVAREQHFTRAAAELHLAQSALSMQVQRLERELGVVLFERGRRGVRLTEAGQAFLVRAEHILAHVEQVTAEMAAYAGMRRGRVRLGTLQSLGAGRLAALLARFHTAYPTLELMVREDVTEALTTQIAQGQLDLALVHATHPVERQTPAGGTRPTLPPTRALPPFLADTQLAMEPVAVEEVMLLVRRSHPLARRARVAFGELSAEPFVAFRPGSGLRRALGEAGVLAGFAPRIVCESGDLGTIRALVGQGLGVSLVPHIVGEISGPDVALVRLEAPALARTILLIWRKEERLSPAAAACLEYLRADLQRHPW